MSDDAHIYSRKLELAMTSVALIALMQQPEFQPGGVTYRRDLPKTIPRAERENCKKAKREANRSRKRNRGR